ncbi:hypothetical protein SAMN04487996_10183 [Dyadobacter soli]|uniref:Uncharacterized protein n=1 Tax=Dyadobacter soli TaxID=659014 RepID=A0A1G6UXS9_9BACT|nr:hypothetical protein [Dyadobacter soli]SDD46043.1 hypothetical protein SAMN04487996_10183 [Dyadobacter soli]
MLEVVIFLAIISLVLLFLRAGRQNTVVYRRKTASPDSGYSISDHSAAAGSPVSSDFYSDNGASAGYTGQEALAFGGGEYGGGGAGDSYDIAAGDSFGVDQNIYDTVGGDFGSTDCDSGTNDSGSDDSCSDSSGDSSSCSND